MIMKLFVCWNVKLLLVESIQKNSEISNNQIPEDIGCSFCKYCLGSDGEFNGTTIKNKETNIKVGYQRPDVRVSSGTDARREAESHFVSKGRIDVAHGRAQRSASEHVRLELLVFSQHFLDYHVPGCRTG